MCLPSGFVGRLVARAAVRKEAVGGAALTVGDVHIAEPAVRVDLGEADAPLGLAHQHAPDELGAVGRQARRQVVLAVEDHGQRLAVVGLLEGRAARHQHVQDHAQAPDV